VKESSRFYRPPPQLQLQCLGQLAQLAQKAKFAGMIPKGQLRDPLSVIRQLERKSKKCIEIARKHWLGKMMFYLSDFEVESMERMERDVGDTLVTSDVCDFAQHEHLTAVYRSTSSFTDRFLFWFFLSLGFYFFSSSFSQNLNSNA
jgi:hypothetical protein